MTSIKMTGIRASKTIETIVKRGLCTGCGTCVGICPTSALKMVKNDSKGIYLPQLNSNDCNQCGICFEICPGHSVDFKNLNLAVFGKEQADNLIGNYMNSYIGHATNHEIRYNSASGGLVTAILIFALEEGIIDGALVTRMKKDHPLEPEPFIARTREEIIEASKSKYCPVPANLALKEILKENGKFAVVGLPCHIHGIRKAEIVNNKLKEKIALHLGILCSVNRNFLATEYLLQKFNIKKEDVAKLDYRGDGWIGGMTITSKNGTKKFIPLPTYWGHMLKEYFVPTRCTLCSDQSCELADISFGDIWLPEFRNDKIGTSVIISRSKMGETILQNAVSKKELELNNINKDKLIESQKRPLIVKKNQLKARFFLFKISHKNIPNYNQNLLKPNLIAYLRAVLLYLQISLSSKRYLWSLLAPLASFLGFLGYWYRKHERIVNIKEYKRMKKNNIFILGASNLASKGVHAMAISTMMILRRYIPDARFTIVSTYPRVEHDLYVPYKFNLRLVRNKKSRWGKILVLLKEYVKADMIVDIEGDGFSDEAGTVTSVEHSVGILLAIFMRKPILLFPTSIGPFNTKLTRFLAIFSLNRVEGVVAREEITKKYLQEMGIKESLIYLTLDTAFILPEPPYERVKEIFSKEGIDKGGKTLIGMNISQLLSYKSKKGEAKHDYITLMAQIADYLAINLNAMVIFIPHSIYLKEAVEIKGETKRIGGDDITAVKEAFKRVKNKDKIIPIVNDYTVAELKGIIGQCDLFIGARMHANIAAISIGVPTVAIAYSHKAPGIMSMVGLKDYVCDFRTMDFEELTSMINMMWSNREELRKNLISKVKELKEAVWLNGKLAKEVLNKRHE